MKYLLIVKLKEKKKRKNLSKIKDTYVLPIFSTLNNIKYGSIAAYLSIFSAFLFFAFIVEYITNQQLMIVSIILYYISLMLSMIGYIKKEAGIGKHIP